MRPLQSQIKARRPALPVASGKWLSSLRDARCGVARRKEKGTATLGMAVARKTPTMPRVT